MSVQASSSRPATKSVGAAVVDLVLTLIILVVVFLTFLIAPLVALALAYLTFAVLSSRRKRPQAAQPALSQAGRPGTSGRPRGGFGAGSAP